MAGPKGPFGDIETGQQQLYPNMMENPQFRWAFIRKVYVILSMQLLLTVVIASIVVFVPQISHFMIHTRAGLALYIVILIAPIIIICPMYACMKKHPINIILLALFTVAISFAVGMSCAFAKGKVVLEAAILTFVVTISLTLYTFWAVKRGRDFSFLGPFLFAALMCLIVFSLIQIFIPLGKISLMIYGCIAAIIFSAYIVYDTNNLIKYFSYDEYVGAAASLYLDIVNLFLAFLTFFQAADN